MRLLLYFILVFSAPLTAGVYTHYGVRSAAKEWNPDPSLGFGVRSRSWDVKGTYTPSKRKDELTVNATRRLHLGRSPFYVGGGAGLHTSFSQNRFQEKWTSGEATLGVELSPRAHLQLEVSRPLTARERPSAALSFGLGF